MRRLIVIVLVALWGSGVGRAEEAGSPHQGTDMCSVCHNDDMTLQRSELETCTFCHGSAPHSGAAEHLRLEPARVAQALAARPKDAVSLPLSEERRIWCGTCHLYHDPSLGEPWLTSGWVPPETGLSGAVRGSVTARWDAIASAHGSKQVGASFAHRGTRQLRLPVDDGSLCRHCHGSGP